VKLFQKLLVAPAALGLLSPLAATANELNLSEVSGYSSSEEVQNINEFNAKQLAVTNSRVDGLEARLNNYEAGSFSETTVLTGSAHFQIGAVDGSAITEALTSTYAYDLDLNTTFTGDDNLYVGFEAGNSSTSVDFATDNSNAPSTADVLTLDSLYYAFPVGSYEVAVGPKIDNDDFMPTSTSKYSDRFFLAGQAITPSNFTWDLGITGTGVAVARNFDNGWNASASIIGLNGSSASGLLTKEGTDTYTVSVGYDGDNYGLGLIYVDADEVCSFIAAYETCTNVGIPTSGIDGNSTTFGGYWTPNDGKTTVSANLGAISYDVTGYTTEDLTQWFLGVDHQIGNGVLSAAVKNSDWFVVSGSKVHAVNLGEFGEILYTYDVNDSMEITGGFAFAMPANNVNVTWRDRTAVGLEATFKF